MSDLDRKTTDPLPQGMTLKRLKRSRSLHMSGLMATVGFSMAACGAPQVAVPEPEPAQAYASLTECKAANDISDAECDTAYAAADRQAREEGPRYASREECEGEWGPEQCRQLNTGSGGGSFFGPLVTGFFLGQLLNNGRYGVGGPVYRDRDNQYRTGGAYGGGYLGRDYRTGRTVVNRPDTDVVRQAPQRVQSRTATVSRGGFGGGGRGYGG